MTKSLRCAATTTMVWSLFFVTSPQAAEIKIGITHQKDAFIESLINSKDLKSVGISLVTAQFQNDREVFDATVDGTIEVGLFALSALDQARLDNSLRLYTTFTRPFLFKNTDEIFAIQDTALGDAILAEIRRARVLPLRFWNRGLSQIVSRTPISSVKDFSGLSVGAPSSDQSTNNPVLISLGAKPTDLGADERVSEIMSHGTVEATVWEPWTHYQAAEWRSSLKDDFAGNQVRLYLTDFQPVVGVLSAAEKYWDGLTERERQAWKRAAHEASRQSRSQISASEQIVSNTYKVKLVTPSEKERVQLTVAASPDPKIRQDLQAFEEIKSQLRIAEDSVKKKK